MLINIILDIKYEIVPINYIMIKHKISQLLILFSFLLFLSSCKDDSSTNTDLLKDKIQTISNTMEEWYLWPDEIKNVSTDNYSSYYNFMKDMRADKDKWSNAQDLNLLRAYLEQGAVKDFGFEIFFNHYDPNSLDDNDLRVKQVYEDSELNALNVTRSWRIVKLNNVEIIGSTYDDIIAQWKMEDCEFMNVNGTYVNVNISRKQRKHNTVIYRDVQTYEGVNIAYLVFDSFLDVSEDELNEAFTYFKNNKAQQLIVDLRYNGGGAVKIANQLAGLISGNKFKGKIFSHVKHRDSKIHENRDNLFTDQSEALFFSKLVIICSSSTASSSELVINGLKPYLGKSNVILVGSKTHGKPVGMYVFSNEKLNLAILPICFSSTNADDEGEYYEGIEVDYKVKDNLMFPFGDIKEDCYKVAVDVLTGKNIATSALKSFSPNKQREVPSSGLKNEIGCIIEI